MKVVDQRTSRAFKQQAEGVGAVRERLIDWWPLFPVIIVALVVRLVGVDWGLPFIYDFDEPNNLIRTLTMLNEGDPNPHWFHYGSLMFYLYGGAILAVAGTLNVFAGGFELSTVDFPEMIAAGSGLMPEAWPLLVARHASVLLSVGTVVVIFMIVRRLTSRPWAAGYSALLFSLAPVAVTEGRLFSPNTLSGLFAALAIGTSIRVYRSGRSRDYLIAGLMVGLAAGSKYNAGLVGICVLIAHWLRQREDEPVLARGPLTAIYAAIGAFLITTPFAVLDAAEFLGDVGFELAHYSGGHVGSDGSGAFLIAFLTAFSASLLVIPFGVLDTRYRGPMLIVLGFGTVYLAVFSLFQTSFARNLLPVLPAFCVAVGLGVAAVWDRREGSARVWRVAAAIALTTAVVVSGLTVLSEYRALEDRTAASEWIAANIPFGSRVLVDAYSPWVEASSYRVLYLGIVGSVPISDSFDYLLLTPRGSGRYERPSVELDRLEAIRVSTCLVQEFADVVEIRAPNCS